MIPKAKRYSTVNQPDIRGLSAEGGQSSHDYDSSGAASIYSRASWTYSCPLHKGTTRVLRAVASPPGS